MGFKHYKFQPNEYVLVMKNGKVIKQGVGLSFFCNTLSTGMSVVPTVESTIDVIRESVDIIDVMKPIYNFKASE